LAGAVYLTAALLAVIPVFDLLSTVWPLQPRNLSWRYGFLGLLGNFFLTPMLGGVLASATAALLRHTLTLRVLSFAYIGLAALLAVGLLLFAMDVVQLRAQLTEDVIPNYQRTAALAASKYVLGMVALIWLGVGGLQTGKNLRPGSSRGD
jgi:hypothetical protein